MYAAKSCKLVAMCLYEHSSSKPAEHNIMLKPLCIYATSITILASKHVLQVCGVLAGLTFQDLRSLLPVMSPEDLGMAGQATALLQWHKVGCHTDEIKLWYSGSASGISVMLNRWQADYECHCRLLAAGQSVLC